jgi:5-methylthioadenosine/S-adenosylhomocysteine deaminase
MDTGDLMPPQMKEPTDVAIRKTEELYDAFNGSANDRIHIWYGIRSAMTSTPDLATRVAAGARERNTGMHSHLAEHLAEVEYCFHKYGKRVAEWFDSFGLLRPGFIGAHAVRLRDEEIFLLSERGASVVHCPRSNLHSHGFPKTTTLLMAGVNVAVGTDGASGNALNLFESARLLKSAIQAFFGININDPITLSVQDILCMMTIAGARALMLEEDIGTLEVGKKADIILLDFERPHLTPTYDRVGTLVMAGQAADITDVVVDGRVLMENRALRYLDEEAIIAKVKEHLLTIRQRAGL